MDILGFSSVKTDSSFEDCAIPILKPVLMNLSELYVQNIAFSTEDTKQAMFALILTVIQTTFSLRIMSLKKLGLPAEKFEIIFDILLERNTTTL